MKKNKRKQSVQLKKQEEKFLTCLLGEHIIQFDIEYEKSLIDWKYDKQGRNLSIEMICDLSDEDNKAGCLKLYNKLHALSFGRNFVMENVLNFNEPIRIDRLFSLLSLNPVLFDFVVIKCTISYEDEDQYSEFTRFHGIGLTVNGKKHLAEESNSNEADSSASPPE